MPNKTGLRLMVAAGLLWPTASAAAADRIPPLATAELLVDLARDHALSQRGKQTPADVQHVRTLLQAALRLDPLLPDAYVWLCELATLEGSPAEEVRLLAGLLAAQPRHESAFARWLDTGAAARQTAEKRVEWLETVADTPRPPPLEAMLHVALARLAQERLDSAEARRQLTQALELEPANLDAAWLTLETLDKDAPPADRLRATLRVLQLTPQSVAIAGQVAAALDEYGFVEEAARFYDHAVTVQRLADPQAALPGQLLLGLARNLLARGDIDAALERTREAIGGDPRSAAEAALFLHYLLKQKEPGSEAEVRQQLASRFAAIHDPAEHPVNEVSQAAWFYDTIEPQPDRALMLARTAADRAPGDPFIQRVLGWAQALALKPDEARQTLAPLAGHDPYAAGMLVRLLRAAGKEAEARRVLDRLDPRPTTGPACDLLLDLDASVSTQPASQSASTQRDVAPSSRPATSQPARVRYPELAQAVADFDARVLEYCKNPARFLVAQVALDSRSLSPGEPWWAVFSLTNRGPFPITCGPDGMVNPVFTLSFSAEGDRKRDFPALLTVSLDQQQVLYPGQNVRVRRTLDVGPLRRVARESPQQAQRVTLQALLDGVLGADGQWRPSPGGQQLDPVYFNRLPASTTPEAITALCQAATEESLVSFAPAVEVMAELIGEGQRADLKRLEYKPTAVATDRMCATLLSALRSESWELRARTLDALQVMGLDRRMVAAVEACLEHPHWVVRMFALRVLARQGPSFRERAVAIARDDGDELVRALADSFVQKWAPKE